MARSMLRLLLFLLLLLAWSLPAWAQTLTPAQYSALRTDITTTRKPQFDAWISPPADKVDDQKIADFYNALASPTVNLWRPDVRVEELNTGIVWADFLALTPDQKQTYIAMTQAGFINTTVQSVRDGFTVIFGNGSASATTLLGIVKKVGTNFEVLFAGSAVQGARVSQVYGKTLTQIDVAIALRGTP